MRNKYDFEDERAERIWLLFLKVISVPAILGIAIAIFKMAKSI